MPNRNYEKGRRFEYKIKHILEDAGHIVLRTAGSHGAVDLIAIKGNRIAFLQCKVTKDASTAKRLAEEFKKYPPYPKLDYISQAIVVKSPKKVETTFWKS